MMEPCTKNKNDKNEQDNDRVYEKKECRANDLSTIQTE